MIVSTGRCLVDPKSQYAQWLSGRTEFARSVALGPMGSVCAEPVRELKGGFSQSPQILQGPQQGLHPRFAWCMSARRTAQARYGSVGTTSVPFGKVLAAAARWCFHSTALPGAMRVRRRRSSGRVSMRELRRVVPSQLPCPRSGAAQLSRKRSSIVAAIASRTASAPCPVSGGRS